MGKKTAVVATRQFEEVARLLRGWEIREALSTDGVYRALRGASLVVVDRDLPEGSLSRSGLEKLLNRSGAVVVSTEEFLTDPEGAMAQARREGGGGKGVPLSPLRVGICALSGGTGCTTLALEVARWAVRQGGTAAVLELPWGVGALASRLNLNGSFPDLYQVAMGLREPGQAEGITVVPAGETMRLLWASPEAVVEVLNRLAREHILVVVDAHGAHPLWESVRRGMDRVLVVADTRPDAVANARLLLDREEGQASLVVNRVHLADRAALALAGERALVIPEGARDIGERLGRFLWGRRW